MSDILVIKKSLIVLFVQSTDASAAPVPAVGWAYDAGGIIMRTEQMTDICPDLFNSDRDQGGPEDEIMAQILYILNRNRNAKYLKMVLTRARSLEQLMI